jgi:hypothetical protein
MYVNLAPISFHVTTPTHLMFVCLFLIFCIGRNESEFINEIV